MINQIEGDSGCTKYQLKAASRNAVTDIHCHKNAKRKAKIWIIKFKFIDWHRNVRVNFKEFHSKNLTNDYFPTLTGYLSAALCYLNCSLAFQNVPLDKHDCFLHGSVLFLTNLLHSTYALLHLSHKYRKKSIPWSLATYFTCLNNTLFQKDKPLLFDLAGQLLGIDIPFDMANVCDKTGHWHRSISWIHYIGSISIGLLL